MMAVRAHHFYPPTTRLPAMWIGAHVATATFGLLSLAFIADIPQARAQTPAATDTVPAVTLSTDQQIAAAVLPLPAEMRDSATVLGYESNAKLVKLRSGSGSMICLAPQVRSPRFHVACYHRSLEPFMARGRALRTSGVKGDAVDSVRFREAKAGRLKLPRQAAALYSLTGPWDVFDTATVTAPKARPLFVVYMPYATAGSTGLRTTPIKDGPWLMGAGTPKAHIMVVPDMQP
ncbi:MAG: hypothetical protein ABR543_12045 [Gemmatimonadaceae bacterium]